MASRIGPGFTRGLVVVMLLFSMSASSGPTIIFDTDMFEDVDDVGALAMLNEFERRGEAKLAAVVINTNSLWSAYCADAINTYFGHPDVPVGILYPTTMNTSGHDDYVAVCSTFPQDLRSSGSVPTALSIYRRVLAAQPNGSVTIVSVGFLTNLEDLLKSGPDSYSPLSGVELVAAKVKDLHVMGGQFPSSGGGAEFNFALDPSAAAYVNDHWPTRLVFSGFEVGVNVYTGGTLSSTTPANNVVRKSYELYLGCSNCSRPSWDLTSVYHAVRPTDGLFQEIGNGSNTVNPGSGSNAWVSSPVKNHFYLRKLKSNEVIATTMEALINRVPNGWPIPTPPTNLVTTGRTSRSVSLQWTAATDDTEVTGYDVYVGTSLVGSVTGGTDLTVTGLSPSTAYSFTVKARDGVGNVSSASSPLVVTTDAFGDGTGAFVKGINLNGGAVTIEGNAWSSYSSALSSGLTISTVNHATHDVVPQPATDAATTSMLRSEIWYTGDVALSQALSNGTYTVYFWVLEDFRQGYRSFDVSLEGVARGTISTGSVGSWKKYGPFTTTVSDGTLNVSLNRIFGDVLLQGVVILNAGSPTTGGTFVKGVNLNGGAVTIEGKAWSSHSAALSSGLTISPVNLATHSMTPNPATDVDTTSMLRSEIWYSGNATLSQSLPNGTYSVYLWVLEDHVDNYHSFDVRLEGVKKGSITTQAVGRWNKYGPYTATVNDGALTIDLVRLSGDILLQGFAIYQM